MIHEFDPFAGPSILSTAPTTESQREIWTAAKAEPHASLAYNESISLVLRGELDLSALQYSFEELLGRHEALRTTISGDGLTMCIAGAGPVAAPLLDLSGLPRAEADARLGALLASEVETPFDLELGPLYRLHLVRLTASELRAVFTAHHIVCDGWATAVLLKDWAALYNARLAGAHAELPLAATFSSFASAQAQAQATAQAAQDEGYWLKQFAGSLPVLELPSDRARPPLKTYASRRVDLTLDGELLTSLKKTAGRLRANLFTTLLSAFDVLLYRLTHDPELVVGIPAAGQALGGFDNLVGHCVNMLAIRSRVQGDAPFAELVAQVRSTMLDAYEHQQYTYGTLLSKLVLPRDPSRLPLTSVIFNVDRGLTSDALGFTGLSAECLTNPRHYENFDLFLNVVELPGRLLLECQYNLDLFDEATVRRWLAAYERLLRAIVADANQSVRALPVLSDEERALLASWNDAAATAALDTCCVHELIESAVVRDPAAIACEFEGVRLSYGELNRQANQLARRLRRMGVEGGSLVGLCVERSLDMLVGVVGILKAGAGYVPLDPDYPAERLSFMAEDATLQVLISESRQSLAKSLPQSRTLLLDEERARLAQEDGENLPPDSASATGDTTAYVIFTSGSTGKPKGVLVPQRALVNLLGSVRKQPGMKASDVVLAVTTLSFDISISELILPLTVGAKIVLVSREVASDGARLLETVVRSGITFIDATPATYRLLLSAGWTGDRQLTAICTGEAMPRDLAQTLVERLGQLWNGYGPTETTVWSTFYRVTSPLERVLIGKPVDNTRIYLLDEAMQPVPLGVRGELFIGGVGVAHGYLKRPELTAERFLTDPFAADPAARMYRTGDVARYLPSGDLECLGRTDHQVKLRGYRIELGEIEDTLGRHASVQQAAVVVREDQPGKQRLVAYLVMRGEEQTADAELRAHLKRALPDYMVPASYVRLASMPLTATGKIERKALPNPEPSQGASQDFVPAETATQQLLASLWQDVLSVPRVSIADDFFALGGHSLLASQLLARLRTESGIQVSFRKIFEAPTIAQLAAYIDAQAHTLQDSSASTLTSPIARREPGEAAPLSLAQERIWLLEEMDPSMELVHVLPAAWRFEGPVRLAFLQRALDEIVRRHEPLRTTISNDQGRAGQVVAATLSLPIEEIDLRGEPLEQREALLRAAVQRLTRVRFDLAQGPLFRSYLFRLADDSCVYFTLRHNVIWDGWSFDIFLSELCALYAAYEQEVEPSLPSLPVTYGEYVLWHRQFLEGPEIARQTAWWRERLTGELPELALPADRARPNKSSHAGDNASIRLTRDEADALTALGKSVGGTLFTTLLAAYGLLLHRYSGQDEILIGTPVRARNRPEAEPLIGPFVNAVVLRMQLEPTMSFHDLLGNVRELTLDALSNQDMPLEKLGTRPPVVRAFFSLQDARNRPPSLGSIPVAQMHVEPPAAASDLMLWAMETRSELLAVVNYSTELFDAATIQRLLEALKLLLRGVIADPRCSLADLPIASDAELTKLRGWGSPAGEPGRPLLQCVREHARERAAQLALREGADALSYAELSGRAAATAAQLGARGVGPGALVGIYACTAPLRAVAWLALEQLGATALLFDPSWPAARNLAMTQPRPLDLLLVAEGSDPPAGLARELLVYGGAEQPASDPACEYDAGATQVLIARFDAQGQPVLYPVSYAGLCAGTSAVAGALAIAAGQLVVGLSHASGELALFEMLAPLAVGASFLAAGPDARLPKGTRLVFGPVARLLEANTADLAQAEDVVLLDPPDAAQLAQLLRGGGRVHRLHAFPEAGLTPFVGLLESAAQAARLGTPLYPTRLQIVDRHGAQAPTGVTGELRVASAFPTTGGDSQPRPVAARARFRLDGSVELTQVTGGAVTLGGNSVWLDEVAGALAQHESVEQGVVLLAPRRAASAELVAFFVSRSGASYTESELRRHLRARLPEAMLPRAFIEIDALPFTDQGRIDEARLLASYRRDDDVEPAAPRSTSEKLLARIWREELGNERIGLHDNFFDLGGHSLLCFKVIARLEQETGKRLSPRVVLLGSLEQVAVELDAAPARVESPPPVVAAARASAAVAPAARSGGLFQKLKGFLGR